MTRLIQLAGPLAIALLGCAWPASADLLWDNFLTDNPAADGGFDGHSYFSSEQNAAVQDTWATDDAVFTFPVTIQGIKWVAGYDPRWSYTAEIIILAEDADSDSYAPWPGFPLAVTNWQVTATFGTFYGFRVYNGYAELPDVELPPGHYYFGVRLVSGQGGQGDGRNVALTTGNGQINGQTMGLVRPGPEPNYNWMFINQYPGETATDYGFQLYGIPEPASLGLLGLGWLLLVRRRFVGTRQ